MTKALDFKTLYNNHRASVMRLCMGYFAGNQQKADEVCQEIFIRVWKYLDRFEGKSEVSTWIYRIAVNTCLNALRTSKKDFKNVELNENIADSEDSDPNLSDSQLQSLYACIETLNPKDKTIILLVLEQETYSEIAKITGISENNLRVKIHRIKDKLSKCVQI